MSEPWIPIRYVQHDQTCHLCWQRIPKASPGSRVGDRGTKAWWLRGAMLRCAISGRVLLRELWECLACHDERTRADLAA